jgi:hypothetical protein
MACNADLSCAQVKDEPARDGAIGTDDPASAGGDKATTANGQGGGGAAAAGSAGDADAAPAAGAGGPSGQGEHDAAAADGQMTPTKAEGADLADGLLVRAAERV